MASPLYNGKITLTNAANVSVTEWDVEFTFSDSDGVFLGTDVAVNDILFLDTGNYEPGSITKYKLTSITFQDFASVQGRIEFADTNASVPDVAYSIGLDGFISRLTSTRGLSIVPAPGVQGLPDKFAVYPKNYDTVEILDVGTGTAQTLLHTITSPEESAKQIVLSPAPSTTNHLSLTPVGGSPQFYSIDFTLTGGNTIDWNGLGLDGVLEAGDIVEINYFS